MCVQVCLRVCPVNGVYKTKWKFQINDAIAYYYKFFLAVFLWLPFNYLISFGIALGLSWREGGEGKSDGWQVYMEKVGKEGRDIY